MAGVWRWRASMIVAALAVGLAAPAVSRAAAPTCAGQSSRVGGEQVRLSFTCGANGVSSFTVQASRPLASLTDPTAAYGCERRTQVAFECSDIHSGVSSTPSAVATLGGPPCQGTGLVLRVTPTLNFQPPALSPFTLAGPCGGVPRCKASQLAAWAGLTTGGLGHFLTEFAFVNRGRSQCSLIGNPRLLMLDATGHPIRTIDEDSVPGALGIERKTVVLAKGQRAYFGVYYANKTGFGNLVCPTSAKLRMTLPGRRDSIVLSGRVARIAPYGGTAGHPCGRFEVTPVTARRFQ